MIQDPGSRSPSTWTGPSHSPLTQAQQQQALNKPLTMFVMNPQWVQPGGQTGQRDTHGWMKIPGIPLDHGRGGQRGVVSPNTEGEEFQLS